MKRISHNRLKIEEVIGFIESAECEFLGGQYESIKSELLIKFRCNHDDWVRFDVFRKSRTFLCRKCQKIKIGNEFKLTEKNIIELLESIGLKFVGLPNGYDNQKSIVSYKCEKGHTCSVQYATIKRKKKCSQCSLETQYKNRRGKGHPLWNGGTSLISPLIKGNMIEWKKESIKNSDYKCVVTGDKFQAVHHLYSFNMILEEVLELLNLSNKNYVQDYSEEEMEQIILESKKIHQKYPLGVCLRKDIHILFHQIYGSKNNTPEQFYEFVDRINSGEIIIN